MNDDKMDGILTFKIVDKNNSSQDEIALSIEESKEPIYVSKDRSFRWISKEDAHFVNINEHKFKISVEKQCKVKKVDSFSSSYSSSNIYSSNNFNSKLSSNFSSGSGSSSQSSGICGYGLNLI